MGISGNMLGEGRRLCMALALMAAVCLTACAGRAAEDGDAGCDPGEECPAETEELEILIEIEIPEIAISDEEKLMLQKISLAEAEDHGVKGMALVMCVVMNRVNSSEWPDTIEEVIFQKGQFQAVDNGRYEMMTPDDLSGEALRWIESGWDLSEGAEYFCEEKANRWFERHLKRLFKYKTHIFYK